MWYFLCEKSLILLYIFLENFFGWFRKWQCIIMWIFIFEKNLFHFSSLQIMPNLILEIPSLEVELFYSAISFHHVIWYCHTYTVMVSKHKFEHPRKILHIRIKLLKLCCHEIVIILGKKRLGAEVESHISLYTQVIGVEVKIQVPRVTWPSKSIDLMESMYKFVCIHPNIWLYRPSYIKSIYIISLRLRLSRSYRLVC